MHHAAANPNLGSHTTQVENRRHTRPYKTKHGNTHSIVEGSESLGHPATMMSVPDRDMSCGVNNQDCGATRGTRLDNQACSATCGKESRSEAFELLAASQQYRTITTDRRMKPSAAFNARLELWMTFRDAIRTCPST